MAIKADKLLDRPSGKSAMIGGSSVSVVLTKKSIKNIGIMRTKVTQIEGILKGTLALEKKDLDNKKRLDSRRRRESQEDKLETKPNAEKGQMKMPSAPRLGILDWIKNFIGKIILGYFAVRLIDHLPKIMPIVKFLGSAADFIIDVGGKLLDGLVTFVDWGYKAYDASRGFVKNLFGNDGVKQFDQLSGLLNKFLNLIIIAGMITAGSGGFGGGRGRGGGPRGKPGPRGNPRITTSGGGAQGRPDIRNPLRQRPTVTTGTGGTPKFRLPGTGPKITGAKGVLSSVRPFLKRIPLPVVGALIDFGLSVALGEDPGRAAFRAIGAGLLGAVGAAAGSVVPVAGNFLGGLAGGFVGDAVGGALYDAFFGGKSSKSKATGRAGGGPTRGGKTMGGVKRTLSSSKMKKYRRTLSKKPSEIDLSSPGSDVGGEDKLFGLFPNPLKAAQKVMNPFSVIQEGGKTLGKTDYFGPILAITSKILTGQKPSQKDYENVGLGINLLVSQGIREGQLKGGLAAAFQTGGLVDPETIFAATEGGDITDWVSRTFKDGIESKVEKNLRMIEENLRLKREESEKKPGDESGTEGDSGDDGTGGSEGGITGTGVAKGISVAKKLIADLGVTPAQAAGIVGNFLYESAGMNPGEREGSPYGTPEKPPALGTLRVGYGWAQWTNSAPGDRLDKFLKSYGGDKGKIATDNDNYRYLMTELKGTETLNRKGVVTRTLFPKDDPIAASDWFRKNWERAGIPADEKRRKETLAVFEKIKGLSRDQAKADVAASGGVIAARSIGDERITGAGSPKAKQIIAGARKVIGSGARVDNDCARTTRRALAAGGLKQFGLSAEGGGGKTTNKGDLDTPKGSSWTRGEAAAASFGGSDLGQIIKNKSNIKAGDIILWRQTTASGKYNKGAITHVGIAADDGLKHQYDHTSSGPEGFHYRSHWDSFGGTNWFAGVRLMGAGGMIDGITPAILGEEGKPEGVIGSKITQLLEDMAPGILPAIIGSKSKDELTNVLRTFSDYGFGPGDEFLVFDEGGDDVSSLNSPTSVAVSVFGGEGGNSDTQILYQGC